MRITLIYPDYAADGDNSKGRGFYSEGIASLSAVLKEAGHKIKLFHLVRKPIPDDFKKRIKEDNPDIIAITVRTTIFPYIKDFAKWIKEAKADTIVICGGVHPTLIPDEVLAIDGVDLVSLGEGEYTLLELCEKLEKDEPINNIDGTWAKNGNNEFIKNPIRPLIENLDDLPLPDFNIYDYPNLFSMAINTAPVMLSRGCPYNCTYCCNHQIRSIYPNQNKYCRFRSPKRSIEYIKTIINQYPNVKYIDFRDNILPFNRKWFFEFIELYKKEIKLPFVCRHRANLVQRDDIQALKEAGCYLIHFGVESGNEYIQNTILKRGLTNKQIINAFKICNEVGISTLAYNMLGLPYEDLSRTLETIKLNAKIRATRVMHPIFYPYPKTKLYEISLEGNFIPTNLDYADEVRLTQPQYPREQVLFARAYFHHYVKIYRLIELMPNFIHPYIERFIDFTFITPIKPHHFLTQIAGIHVSIETKLKNILRNRFPKLYLWLRDRMVKQR